jgi:hypothetical protein
VESTENGRGPRLHGRDHIVDMVWNECLPRARRDRGDLPIVVLLGPRGSGKTSVLRQLAVNCRQQAAQPFVPVLDLERRGTDERCWWVVAELAYALSGARWPQFGRLRFPRFALGHMIVEGIIPTRDPQQTQNAIVALLARAHNLDQKAQNVDRITEFIGRLPQLLGYANWIGVLGDLASRVIRSRRMVRFLFRTGMEFYREALQRPPNSGWATLVELGRLGKESGQDSRNTVDEVLCEAFLVDLAENYTHGFRPTNCLALLDNVHTEVGQAFLTALAAAKAHRAGEHPPLAVVATSRRIDAFTRLVATGVAHEDYASLWTHLPDDTNAGVESWRADSARSWVYPVRLSDLTADGVRSLENELYPDPVSPRGLAPFVWSVTRGHPWGAAKLLEALAESGARQRKLTSRELSAVLEARCPGDEPVLGELAADYLLMNDLHRTRKGHTMAWAAARDVVSAETCLPDTAGLQAQVAPSCWLSRPDGTERDPVLHPWVRRIMLRKLARSTMRTTSWGAVYRRLQSRSDGTLAGGYYALAAGNLAAAMANLNARFDELTDATEWIAEFNTITSAPHQATGEEAALGLHERLTEQLLATPPAEHPERDPHDDRWLTIVDMALARWIWSDPLCDPTLEMNLIIANGFRDLARRSPRGQLRLILEAEFYEKGGRP